MKFPKIRFAVAIATISIGICLLLPAYAQDNSAIRTQKDVAYERIGDVTEAMDIYQPSQTGVV